MNLRLATFAASALLLFTLSGCTGDPLAQDYGDGTGSYQSRDGTVLELAADDRGEPVEFEGTSDSGLVISSSDYAGSVLVVNFWYAICGPCRAEASDLERLYQQNLSSGVAFLGVNTVDQAETARAFAREHAVTYPSLLDADSGAVRLAFSGVVAPSATPTTLVLDRDGRVAARVIGQISPSILTELITTVVTEP